VEIQKDVQKPRTIICRYDPTEAGMYAIQVMWSGTHIPGSPFIVYICSTRSELEQVTSADWNDKLPHQFNGGRPLQSPKESYLAPPND